MKQNQQINFNKDDSFTNSKNQNKNTVPISAIFNIQTSKNQLSNASRNYKNLAPQNDIINEILGKKKAEKISKNSVDEFIGKNYSAIYVLDKGILDYEEDKKIQSKCMKLVPLEKLKEIEKNGGENQQKNIILKGALKRKIESKSNNEKKNMLKKMIENIDNY